MRVVLTAAVLVMVVVTQRPCADHVSNFVTGFDGSGSAKPVVPRPGAIDVPAPPQHYEHLRPDMTEAEVKAAIEREKRRAEAARTQQERSTISPAPAPAPSP